LTRRRFRDCGADGRLIRDIGHDCEVRGTAAIASSSALRDGAEHRNVAPARASVDAISAADAPPAACDERVGGTRQSGHAQPP